ncbi:hypothetical protein AB0L53_46595 [Nonomuraea sp. NPDC052129]|uniref:hypothetical protein n=1 Tax=Nonomuraea sp. NPDC052129 TaxID=3154651 RepID=UPI00342399E8
MQGDVLLVPTNRRHQAGIGALCLAAQSWVAAVWITRDGLHAAPSSGLDLSDAPRMIGWATQAAMAVLVLLVVLHAIRDCVRARTVTAAAALAAGYLLAAWTDVLVNGPAALLLCRHRQGHLTILSPHPARHGMVTLLAGVGIVTAMILAFSAATAALSLHGGPPPPDLPSYLRLPTGGA